MSFSREFAAAFVGGRAHVVVEPRDCPLGVADGGEDRAARAVAVVRR
jgi:hypothetical protein